MYAGGARLTGFKAYVTDAASVSSLVTDVTRQLGRVDILLNIMGGWAVANLFRSLRKHY